MARKKYQSYTEEFRREAVKRSEQPSVTIAQVAADLGISAQQSQLQTGIFCDNMTHFSSQSIFIG